MSKYQTNKPFSPPTPFPSKKPINDGYDHPFKIKGINQSPEKIKLSINSYVFKSPDLRDTIPIAGLDSPIEIEYGDKIWIEFFYDRNLTPMFGVVKVGNKWPYQVINTSRSSESIDVYPSSVELISRFDIKNKIRELEDTIATLAVLQENQETEIEFLANYQFISEEEKTDYLERVQILYEEITASLQALNSSMNQFFSGSPTSIWKKLFRSFLLIGYTTKDMSKGKNGVTFLLPEDTSQQDPNTPVASEQKKYRVIQCWNSDILLVDAVYQNRFPVKIPIVSQRAINFFSIDGEEEEIKNTK